MMAKRREARTPRESFFFGWGGGGSKKRKQATWQGKYGRSERAADTRQREGNLSVTVC